MRERTTVRLVALFIAIDDRIKGPGATVRAGRGISVGGSHDKTDARGI